MTPSPAASTGRLILARHGQSTLDAQGRLSGRNDPPLSPHGVREAEALAYTIGLSREHVLDYVLTSRLEAARHTAEMVMRKLGYRNALETVDALDERDYGELTGMTHAEATAKVGAAIYRHLVHGGYAPDDPLAKAMVAMLETRITPRLCEGASVLVVTYDDNLRALAAHLDKEPISRDPWRTGMAFDYQFDQQLSVLSRDTLQGWKWI